MNTLPPWCTSATLAYSFRLNSETPSNNVIKSMHWMKYRNLRMMWRIWVLSQGLGGSLPKEGPIDRAALVIERHCSGLLDWDNAYGGLKPLLDCLVKKTSKNPQGLGLIEDDSPRHMPYPPVMFQRPAPPKKGFTIINIYNLGEDIDEATAF